jgi:hypothetical protein
MLLPIRRCNLHYKSKNVFIIFRKSTNNVFAKRIHKNFLLLCIFLTITFFAKAQNVIINSTHGTIFGSYPTLKTAFDAINAGTHQGGIAITVVNNTTETATAQLNGPSAPASYVSITLQPSGGAAFTISGNLSTPLVDFNGADYVTVDGLNTAGNSLTFSNANTSSTASTFRFIADATNNIVRNASILGSSTSATSATILFSTGTIGNDYNTISNNDITAEGTNLPYNAIYGTTNNTASSNDYLTISNNNIYDYFSPLGTSCGIFLDATAANIGSSLCTITNNKFYQTSIRNTATGATITSAIKIGNSNTKIAGSGFTISDNIIGYSSNASTGITNYGPNAGVNQDYAFYGIDVSVGNGIITNIQNNTIAGIAINSTYSGTNKIFAGILINNGLVYVGNTTSNKIGLLANGISITTTGVQASSCGIYSNQPGGSPNITNNVITNFNVTSSTVANANIKFSGISLTGNAGYIVSTNTIGNSISTTEYLCYGIEATVGNSLASSVQNNTIEGISVLSTYNGSTSLFSGIHINTGLVNIGNVTGNKIGTSANSISVSTTGISSYSYGIFSNQSNPSNTTINNNTIRNCTFTTSQLGTATNKFTGIYATGSSSYSINTNTMTAAISATEYLIYGIEANFGTVVTSIIDGNTVAGITMTNSYNGTIPLFTGIYIRTGIVNVGGSTGNFIGTSANSIFITSSGATSYSYGIFSDQSIVAPTISKNIIQNILLQNNVTASATIKFTGIYIVGSSGNFININTIGNKIIATNYVVNGIELNMSGTIPNSLQGNTIAGVDISTTLSGTVGVEATPFIGINISNGNANIGNTTGNIIGTSADYIKINTSGNRTHNYGIKIAQSIGSSAIANNTMENFTIKSSATPTVDCTNAFVGISASNTGIYTITKNKIGGENANSISIGNLNATIPHLFTGILCNSTSGVIIGSTTPADSNIVRNVTFYNSGTNAFFPVNTIGSNSFTGIVNMATSTSLVMDYNRVYGIRFSCICRCSKQCSRYWKYRHEF